MPNIQSSCSLLEACRSSSRVIKYWLWKEKKPGAEVWNQFLAWQDILGTWRNHCTACMSHSHPEDTFFPVRFSLFHLNSKCLRSGSSFPNSNEHNETLILVGIAREYKQWKKNNDVSISVQDMELLQRTAATRQHRELYWKLRLGQCGMETEITRLVKYSICFPFLRFKSETWQPIKRVARQIYIEDQCASKSCPFGNHLHYRVSTEYSVCIRPLTLTHSGCARLVAHALLDSFSVQAGNPTYSRHDRLTLMQHTYVRADVSCQSQSHWACPAQPAHNCAVNTSDISARLKLVKISGRRLQSLQKACPWDFVKYCCAYPIPIKKLCKTMRHSLVL